MRDDGKLIARDLAHVWHPCTQMKDHEWFPPVPIARAEGSYLYTTDGRRIIDGISSWWCKSLGHGHPAIREAVRAQMDRFEHVIMAGTTNALLVRLAEELARLAPGLRRAFFADNGSTGVEVAMKMALQFQLQAGNPERTGFVALENGYHGETVLTLAAGDCALYSAPFAAVMPSIPKIGPLPYGRGEEDPVWSGSADRWWPALERWLDDRRDCTAGIVFEPVLQGAGGMRLYSPELLRRLRGWASANSVLLIADEILTGFGRTGRMLACDHAGIRPDLLVLSKGLTAGWLPMAVVLTGETIYREFYDEYRSGRGFMHSNTYCGNALAAAAAVAALEVYRSEGIIDRVAARGAGLRRRMQHVADRTGALCNVRGIGFLAAAELVDPNSGAPFPAHTRMGFRVYREAVARGAWLRPLGDTIYFMPPLNAPDAVLDELADVAVAAIRQATTA